MGDWHDRQRPGVALRVRAALSKCELSRHLSRNGRPADVPPPLDAPLTSAVALIAEAWAVGIGPRPAGPEPTAAQLVEAEAYQRRLYRGR